MQSGGKMSIRTGRNFENYDAKLVAGSLEIYTGKDYINEARVEFHTFDDPDGDGQFYLSEPYVSGYGVFIVSEGNNNMYIGDNLIWRGIEGTIRGDSEIVSKNDEKFESIKYGRDWRVKVYDKSGSGRDEDEVKGGLYILGNAVFESQEGSLRFSGYEKSVGGNEVNKAKKEITYESIENKSERQYESATEKQLFGGSEKSMSKEVKITNIGSSAKVGGNLELIAGTNINVLASSLESLAGIVSLTAGMNVNVLAGEDYESATTAKMKSGTFGLEMESEEKETSSSKAAVSMIKGAGGLEIRAVEDVNIVGSDIEAGGNSVIEAGKNINVLSFEEADYTFLKKEKRKVDLSSALGSIGSLGEGLKEGRIKAASIKGQQTTDERQETTTKARGSNINIGGDLRISAGKDATIMGSNVRAEGVEVEAENINIISAAESHEVKESHKDASIEISVGITNSLVDAYNAGDAAVKAGEAVAKANEELDQAYKDHKEGKISDEALEDAKINLTLASANAAAAATMAYASAASAAVSAKTGGFNASLMIDAQVNESSHKEKTDSNKGSGITATKGNVNLTAKNDIKQVGSGVVSLQGDISYEAGNEVTIKASKDVTRTQDKNESYSASFTIGTGGMSGSLGFEQGGSKSTEVNYNNAVTSAEQGTVKIKSGGNTTLSGANVSGKGIEGEIGGNLKVESLQNTYKAEGKQYGASVGISGGEGRAAIGMPKEGGGVGGVSVSGHYGESKADAAWVGQQTTLTGSESVNITVGGKTTVKGAVIANADVSYNDQGRVVVSNDKGNMTLNTKEFEYIDIKDKDERRSYDYGGGVSFGKGEGKSSALPTDAKSVTVTLKNQGSEKEQINRATIGQGTIIVDGVSMTPDKLPGLNRDVTKSQEITKDIITNQLDANVTVDVRFWTSVYDAISTGDINQLSVVKDTKTIMAGGKEAFDLIKDKLGLSDSEADKFLNLLAKDPGKLTNEEKELIKSILEESNRRYKENALENGDFDTLIREEQVSNNKEKKEEIERRVMDSNIEVYDENKVVKEPISEEYFREKLEEFKKAGQAFCNVFLGGDLSKEGIYIPHDYANNLNDWMENSRDWMDIGLDHVTAQQYAAAGLRVAGTYKDPNTPSGGQKYGDGTKPGHVFAVTGAPLVDGDKYGMVPQVTSYVREEGVGIIKTTPLQTQVRYNKRKTTTYRVYIGGTYNVEK